MDKIVFIINLGTPKSTDLKDIKSYLREFLMDEYVIDKPYWFRYLLVNGIIVNFRSPETKKSYEEIWTKDGSPLKVYTEGLAEAIKKKLSLPVFWAMRYAEPSIAEQFQELLNYLTENKNKKEVEVIFYPLYPHWAMSTYQTVQEKIDEVWEKKYNALRNSFSFTLKKKIMPVFYDNPDYIKTLSASIKPYLKNKWDKIVFSYHGIPERHIYKSDPTKSYCQIDEQCCLKNGNDEAQSKCYRHQVLVTTKLVLEELSIPEEKSVVSFQSRLGRDPWLTPFTNETLKELPKKKVKNILMVCPAFVSDNLETLFENGIENRELFLESGGENFTLVPCLNLDKKWVNFLVDQVTKTS